MLVVLVIGAAGIASVLAACQTQPAAGEASAISPMLRVLEDEPPQFYQYTQVNGVTFPHGAHLEFGLECVDCHGKPSERNPDTAMPDPDDICTMCHDDAMLEDNEDLGAYFAAARALPPEERWPVPYGLSEELTFAHVKHLSAGLECLDCHGNIEAGGPPAGFTMDTCQNCHAEREVVGEDCEGCHTEIRRDVRPEYHDTAWQSEHPLTVYEEAPGWRVGDLGQCGLCHELDRCESCHTATRPTSHDEGWRQAHGAQAPAGWVDGKLGVCEMCHQSADQCIGCHRVTQPADHDDERWRGVHGTHAPEGWADGALGVCGRCHAAIECSTCHRMTTPESHSISGVWRARHGQAYYAALDLETAECAQCHRASDCSGCHAQTPPRDHTPFFKVDGHGLAAEMDRDRCERCHRQDLCTSCHYSTRPRNHLAGWGAPAYGHCVSCHLPVDGAPCTTCHRGPIHRNDPNPQCTDCHPHGGGAVVPHPENGDSCGFCHASYPH